MALYCWIGKDVPSLVKRLEVQLKIRALPCTQDLLRVAKIHGMEHLIGLAAPREVEIKLKVFKALAWMHGHMWT